MTLLLAGAVTIPSANVKAQETDGIETVQQRFQKPPDDARIMMRWWWFGPAVTKAEIKRELNAMKQAGIGGVEIQPTYPVVLDDAQTGIKTLPFLSDEYIDALRYANEEANSLGLRVDVTLGSGWPFGGPSVPIAEAAGRLRVERVKLPDGQESVSVPTLASGEKLVAVFLARTEGKAINPEGTHELTDIKDGMVALPTNRADATEIIFFVSSRTRQQVKRPSVGSEGFVLNHYDRAAVDDYLEHVGNRLIQAFGDKPPYAVFCDSLEAYLSDWTPDLLKEFQKRRGYDLKPYLPALVGDFGARTADIRHDWGQTLSELVNERFVQPLREWAALHHTRFRMQAYGVPPAMLSTNRFVDLPEGEGARWKTLSATRWASSASHLYGRPVTSSETWTWLHSPSFRATPLDIKAEADLHFLQGINQLVGHGWPYTAPSAEYPGWRLYAAGALNDKNPWWLVMPELTGYLQRMSYVLRQGQPANDVALYLPNSDAWAQFQNNQVELIGTLRKRLGDDIVASTLDAGYNFDFFDDDALHEVGKVEPGALALGANKYKVVILPNVERIPLETLRKLADFARHGGILIATRRLPERAPGFEASEAQQGEVQDTVQSLFEGAGAPAHFVADEKTELVSQLSSLLHPDVDFSRDKTDLGFVHRHTRDAEIYFLANTGPLPRAAKATFRVNASRADWWNPFVGTFTPAIVESTSPDATKVSLEFEPYESRVLVFTHGTTPMLRSPVLLTTIAPLPLDLSANWRISFQDGPFVMMDKLHSWTEDEATRYYSGLATYEKEFDVPQDYLQSGARVQLDLGPTKALPVKMLPNGMQAWIDPPVREAAVVYINGKRAGAVWRPPYNLDVTRLLRPGRNQLKIIVGNTAINFMAGRPLPDYKLLNQRYGERFKPQDMDNLQPIPSGLTGPIRILRTPPTPGQ